MWYNVAVKTLIGVDEVGRGPVAGPVAVCAFAMTPEFETVVHEYSTENKLPLRDSKKLTKKQREKWANFFKNEKQNGNCNFVISYVAPETIDAHGIAPSIRKALSVSLDKLSLDSKDVFVFLDGGLKAPDKYINQETVIKGDELHSVISCASIVAKVARDAIMAKFALEYPQYGFETNSGYGTATHMAAIKKYGFTPIHRRTFIHL